jgi:hypothetical protein
VKKFTDGAIDAADENFLRAGEEIGRIGHGGIILWMVGDKDKSN